MPIENFSAAFRVQKDLKQGDTLLLFVLNFSLKYAIRKVQQNQEGFELNGICLLLMCADDVNMLDGNVNTMKKNSEAQLDDSKEDGRDVSAEKMFFVS
jgi:hypothetical protein